MTSCSQPQSRTASITFSRSLCLNLFLWTHILTHSVVPLLMSSLTYISPSYFLIYSLFVLSGLLTDLLTIAITQQTSHPPLSFTHFSLFALSRHHSMNHDSIIQSSNNWCFVGTLDGWIIGLFNQLFNHSAIQSFSHSSNHTIQTINHWIQHSIIPSVTEPNNQEASTSTGEIFFDESGDQKTIIQLFNKSISQRLKLGHRYSVEFVSVS